MRHTVPPKTRHTVVQTRDAPIYFFFVVAPFIRQVHHFESRQCVRMEYFGTYYLIPAGIREPTRYAEWADMTDLL